MKTPPEVRMLSPEESEALLIRAAAGKLTADDVAVIRQTFDTLKYIISLLHQKKAQVKTLLKRIFGIKSEKSKKVQQQLKSKMLTKITDSPSVSNRADPGKNAPKEKPKGHGRLGVDAFSGAEQQIISHSDLKSKDCCPDCLQGRVYEQTDPGVFIGFSGKPAITAEVCRLQKLRCNLCGQVFTAGLPEELKDKVAGTKSGRYYDPSAKSMMAILRYGCGLPLNRLSTLQNNLGIPLAVSTIWDKIKEAAAEMACVFEALMQLGAQGRIIHNDDTGMKILSVIKQIATEQEQEKDKGQGKGKNRIRTGIFTTNILVYLETQKIALFFTGRRHAGENLADLLAKREPGRSPPIQMSDAKSGNTPDHVDTITSYCNAHARRKFVEVADDFPDECLYVIVDVFGKIYKFDAEARQQNLSDRQRLRYHQQNSEPVMTAFHDWMNDQFKTKTVEPNSTLGKATQYVLKHWEELTRFLHVPGVPLDNNISERALKMAILHRKNSLFYKTGQGARVGDLFMSLIHTCQLAGENPYHYLTQLQAHTETVHQDPYRWLPWNYLETMALSERRCA